MMKKVIIIATLCITLLLCSCGASADNTIKGWEPADEQAKAAAEVLGGEGEYALAEFSVDSSFQSVKYGIDCYEGSKLVREDELGTIQLQEGDSNKDIQGGIIGYTVQDGVLHLGYSYLGEGGSVSNIELPGYDADSESGFGQSAIADPVDIQDGEKCYLAALWQGENGTTAQGFLDSPEALEGNEHTWLIYCIFSGSSGN